jgi:hypothetical protein
MDPSHVGENEDSNCLNRSSARFKNFSNMGMAVAGWHWVSKFSKSGNNCQFKNGFSDTWVANGRAGVDDSGFVRVCFGNFAWLIARTAWKITPRVLLGMAADMRCTVQSGVRPGRTACDAMLRAFPATILEMPCRNMELRYGSMEAMEPSCSWDDRHVKGWTAILGHQRSSDLQAGYFTIGKR